MMCKSWRSSPARTGFLTLYSKERPAFSMFSANRLAGQSGQRCLFIGIFLFHIFHDVSWLTIQIFAQFFDCTSIYMASLLNFPKSGLSNDAIPFDSITGNPSFFHHV